MKISVQVGSCQFFSTEGGTCPLCGAAVPPSTPHECRTFEERDVPHVIVMAHQILLGDTLVDGRVITRIRPTIKSGRPAVNLSWRHGDSTRQSTGRFYASTQLAVRQRSGVPA